MRPKEAPIDNASEWDRRLQQMADFGRPPKYQAFKEPLALLGLIYVGRRDQMASKGTLREPLSFTLGLAGALEERCQLRGQPFSRHLLSGLTRIDSAIVAAWLEIGMGDWPTEGFAEWFAAKIDDLSFADRHDTPSSVSRLVASLVGDLNSTRSVFDPACGTGGLLAATAERIEQAMIFGEEISAEARAWAEMRFLVRGLRNVKLAIGNALTDRVFATPVPEGGFDLALSNPPFGLQLDTQARLGANLIGGSTGRLSSETVYIQEIFGSLSASGEAAVIVPNGFLSRGGADRKLRESLVGHDAVRAVIGLPERLFAPGTTIETAILILQRRKQDDLKGRVLFLDARGLGQREGARVVLNETAADRIRTAFRVWRDEVGFSQAVPVEKLAELDFSLSPARHVESVTPPEAMSSLDRRSRIVELDERYAALRQEFEALRLQLASQIDRQYSEQT